jgi:uncharacterized repeat protein (TIGR04052 family)
VRRRAWLPGSLLAAAAFSGCDAETATLAPVTLTFEAVVGAAPFGCSAAQGDLGVSGSTLTFSDFRMYVSEVALLGPDGEVTPVALVPEAPWQSDRVALLDFEDATGACSNGTPETRTSVTAEDPGHAVTGVRLTLGVPADLNHGDASTAASPLDLTGLFWSWNAGYKFLRLDATVDESRPFNFHLGSVGCTRGADAAVTCARPNRAVLTLPGFDPATSVIRLDVAALLAGVDLATDAGGAPGCMASPDDPECGPLFSALGLDLASPDATPGPQVFATVAPR